MPNYPRYCVFCGNSLKNTDEHIFSNWLHKYIPKNADQSHTRTAIRSAESNPLIQGVQYSAKMQGGVATLKIPVVCERKCNNGWMSGWEVAVKPHMISLIRSHP